jgi:tetratricopeptide (TPR) repeat protein
MPQRRPEDVVHVVMTDHRIGRRMGGPELVAPRSEQEPILIDAWPVEPETVGAQADLYRALAVARTGASLDALTDLDRRLAEHAPASYEPLLDLGRGWLERGDAAGAARAEGILTRLLADFPIASTPATAWRALAIARQGRLEEAIAAFEASLAADAAQPEALVNLARLLLRRGDLPAAASRARQALALRPNQVLAWLTLGDIAHKQHDTSVAEQAFETAISWEPRERAGYDRLAALLREADRPDEAASWLASAPATSGN